MTTRDVHRTFVGEVGSTFVGEVWRGIAGVALRRGRRRFGGEGLVQQDVERFRRECEERGFDPAELMRG